MHGYGAERPCTELMLYRMRSTVSPKRKDQPRAEAEAPISGSMQRNCFIVWSDAEKRPKIKGKVQQRMRWLNSITNFPTWIWQTVIGKWRVKSMRSKKLTQLRNGTIMATHRFWIRKYFKLNDTRKHNIIWFCGDAKKSAKAVLSKEFIS